MNMTIILGALELGGIFAILSLGLYISYKILNLPDLTVDGSFTLGCAVSAIFTVHSYPYLGLRCTGYPDRGRPPAPARRIWRPAPPRPSAAPG